MGRKCTVKGCRTGYDENSPKHKTYGFPEHEGDRQSWLRALPNDPRTIKVTKNIAVCAAHWPPDVQLKTVQRHTYPAVPPTIFSEEIPKSCFASPPPPPRTTTKSSSSARNPDIDQTAVFVKQNYFSYFEFDEEFVTRFTANLEMMGKVATSSKDDKEFVLLSHSR